MKFSLRGLLGFLFAAAILLVFSPQGFSQEERTTVRVGLSDNGFSTFEHVSVKFISPDEMLVSDLASSEQFKVKPDSLVTVGIKSSKFTIISGSDILASDISGPIVFTPKEKIGIEGLNRKGLPAYYAGLMELKATKPDKFNIVNVLDIQTYLKGVVPNEMPVSFGLEALKAQAVAARNYANRPQNVYKNYDICDSTACQVYYGINSQRDVSNRAVDETLGIMALYEDEPILALYSSTGGGITEDWKNVYGYGQPSAPSKPYLVSVCDDKNQKFLKTEKEVRDFYSDKTLSYDIKSPRYRWQVEWNKTELEEVLNKTLVEQSRAGLVEPKFDGSYELKNLKDINVLERGNSGKALEIETVFENGTFKVKRELGIRRVLKKNNSMLPSANFFVDKEEIEKTKEEKKELKEQKKAKKEQEKQETNAIFDFEKFVDNDKDDRDDECEDIKFVLTGGGFGHGVGMSQYGAGYMAQTGKKYDEILKHYYSSIKLGTAQKEVSYNPYSLQYKSEFYYNKANKKTYILKVKNPKRVSELNFKINEHEFNPDMSGYSAKTLGMDITKYLKDGANTVIFEPLNIKDKSKTVTYQIEIGN